MRTPTLLLQGLVCWIAVLAPGSSPAAERLAGPIPADLLGVVDGDTLRVTAHIWLGESVEVLVRLRGVDAPEVRGKCAAERTKAGVATGRLRELIGQKLLLEDVEHDKYAGRVIADVVGQDGTRVGAALLAAGLVRSYDGGKRMPWCAEGLPPLSPH